jgi:hypothetical protein
MNRKDSNNVGVCVKSDTLKDDECPKELGFNNATGCCGKCLIVNCLQCSDEYKKCIECVSGFTQTRNKTQCRRKYPNLIADFTY